jgi:hypothetical protein
VSVTDGSLTTDGAQQTVRVIGTVTATPTGTQAVSGTVTANQGTAAATASAWPIKVTDGTDVATVAGTALSVTSGIETAVTTINALTAAGPGVVVDFGSAKANVSAVFFTTAGISAGAVALEVSHDSSNWFRTATPVTLTASSVINIAISNNAFRYARGAITTTVTGGTVSATLMGT